MRRIAALPASVLVAAILGAGPVSSEPRSFRGIQVMPGGTIAGDRIVYQTGDVIVVPAGPGIDGFDSCPSGSVCLFENTSWTGDMVAFSNCCAWNDLAAFGFNNVASSWRNRKSVDGQIAMTAGGGGTRLCLNNNSYSSSMPSGWDNAASSIRVRDASTYC